MQKKKLIIETSEGKETFEIDEFGGRFYVFKLLANILGGQQSKKIGDAPTWDGAIELLKTHIGRPVVGMVMKETGDIAK